MANAENKRKLISAVWIGTLFIFLSFYYGYIERYMPWWCVIATVLIIAATAITIFISLVKQVITVIKIRIGRDLEYFYPIILNLIVLLAPIGAWEDYQSAIKFRACYEGTQNQAYILFREDNSFELNWTGAFFANEWYMGTWQRKNDILILRYQTKPAKALGSKLFIKNNYLIPLDKLIEPRFKQHPMFYLGYCRGDN
jgi:hypothetical protein